ncbi:LysR family transcriptional regulator [Phytomonospora endophytica]|uniref:DNA-binding transcriptional LysR family regulator n=1 Tax=Phytomonospora endophytica TaxID=714109 RepID=A0A841FK14_9ACTN|nr:LysR family transcriptional regulator [Phytomonospora endophytica]MBB6036195.1 DNA-binding transcriptional LysR family regulator [Phytomonospora endophytica]GIG67101.1 hypothetical protein Pen01_33960 [Phytomonospora endophytica]
MSSRLSVEDLALAEAVARHGSIGAAAKELLTTQPSASRRLAALERRLGARLFERDTTGARPTATGREFARHAVRLLSEIDELPDRILTADEAPSLTVGTIQALSPIVFTALDAELPSVTTHPEIDHGPALIQRVHHGLLDAAVVTIAEQTKVPRELRHIRLGVSPLVLVLPEGVAAPDRGKRPLAGRTVLYSTIDRTGETLHSRLSALGAVPRRGATIEATLRIARHRRVPALLSLLAARWWSAPGDRIASSPIPGRLTVSLVTRPPLPRYLADALPGIAHWILGDTGDRDEI